MKKLILTACAIVAAASVHAQGTVAFANAGASAVTNITTQARIPVGTAFHVALYYLADQAATPTTSDFDQRGIVLAGDAVFPQFAGIFNGGTKTAPTATPGALGWFQVRAWEYLYGGTTLDSYGHALAYNGPVVGGRSPLAGTSNVIKVDTGDPTTVPPGTAGSLTGSGLQGFYVVPVPEPTTIGLGLLGLGALLALRRRK